VFSGGEEANKGGSKRERERDRSKLGDRKMSKELVTNNISSKVSKERQSGL
jgi:hypothetical protein